MPVFADTPNRSRYGKTPNKTYSDVRTMLPDTRQQEIERLREANPYPVDDEFTSREVEVEPGKSDGSEPTTSSGEFYDAVFAPGLPTSEAKPEEKPPKPTPTKPKKPKLVLSNQMMDPAELIADLMAQMGFNPEEMEQTGRSRYNAVSADTPTLGIRGTPGDQWMGLLSALLEEKKRKEETTSMRSLGNGRY